MPRQLKVFQTHIGFHDLIVAAPSMKAAAAAWGSTTRLFAQGFAAVTQDSAAVTAALAQPGVVLRRPHGSGGAYKAQPDRPAAPKVTSAQKQAHAAAARKRKLREAQERRAAAKAQRQAKTAAAQELAAIEQQEAELRQRRQKLQKKFHLRSV